MLQDKINNAKKSDWWFYTSIPKWKIKWWILKAKIKIYKNKILTKQ